MDAECASRIKKTTARRGPGAGGGGRAVKLAFLNWLKSTSPVRFSEEEEEESNQTY